MIIKMFGKHYIEKKEYVSYGHHRFLPALTASRNAPQHHQTVKNFAADDATAHLVKCVLRYDLHTHTYTCCTPRA